MNHHEGRFRCAAVVFLFLGSVAMPHASRAQSLQVSHAATAPSAPQSDSDQKRSSLPDQEVTWHQLPKRFLYDQKDIWLFPVKLAEGHHWLPSAIVLGGTAIFIKEDPPLMRKSRQTDIFHGYNRLFSSTTSGAITAIIPVGLYAASLIRKDAYGQSTGLMAGEAVADDTTLIIAMKAIARRARPSEFPPTGSYNDTFFATHNSFLGKGSSFPSGHAMMSFSVATIFAERYRRHKWVPYVAYGIATAISFSRVTTGSHFPSDVFIGAATGFAIARYDVLRRE